MRFNTVALANIAARAVEAERCTSFEKIAEGRSRYLLCTTVAHHRVTGSFYCASITGRKSLLEYRYQ